jgi:hypothetical protein
MAHSSCYTLYNTAFPRERASVLRWLSCGYVLLKPPRNGHNKRYRRCTVCRTQKLTLAHQHSFHVGITLPVAVLCKSPNWRSAWNVLLTPCRLASTECTDHNAALWIPETHEDGCWIWNPWKTTRKMRLPCPYTTRVELLVSHRAPPQVADRGRLTRYGGYWR